MPGSTKRRPRGRPKDPGKREAILRAATRLFLERGFAGTSMDAVAEAAGVAKLTVYGHFGDKDRLFQDMVRRRCDASNRPDGFDAYAALPPEKALLEIGTNFLGLLLSSDALGLYRIMVGEAERQPRMARLFFEAGPERLNTLVSRYLAGASARGELSVPDPARAADHFLALVKGKHHFAASLNLRPRPTSAQVGRHVRDCVSLFLRAHAPGPSRRSPI